MSVKPKSRVNTKNSSQLTQFKFRWWMALILVAVVAIIGIVILRFSHAGTASQTWTASDSELKIAAGFNSGLQAPQSYNINDNGLIVREVVKANTNQSADVQIGVNTPVAAGTIVCVYAKAVNSQGLTVNSSSIPASYIQGFRIFYANTSVSGPGNGGYLQEYLIGGGEPGVRDYNKYCTKVGEDQLTGSIRFENVGIGRGGSFLLNGPYKFRILKIVKGDTSTKFK